MGNDAQTWNDILELVKKKMSPAELKELEFWTNESEANKAFLHQKIKPGELRAELEIQLQRNDEAIWRKFVKLRDQL